MVALNPLTSVTVYLLYFFFSDPNSQLCTTNQRKAMCTQNYQPVCALIRGTNSDSALSGYRYYQKTISNGCSACATGNIIGYVPGECPNTDTQICSKKLRNAKCTQEYNPVCTISEKSKKVSTKTSSNSCTACGSEYSKFFVTSDCSLLDTPQICESKDRKVKACTMDYTPVCAYYKGNGCKEELCRKTQSNYCAGCKNSNVIFVIQGECQN